MAEQCRAKVEDCQLCLHFGNDCQVAFWCRNGRCNKMQRMASSCCHEIEQGNEDPAMEGKMMSYGEDFGSDGMSLV